MNEFCLKIKKVLINRQNDIVADMDRENKKQKLDQNSKNYKIAAVLFPLIEKKNHLEVILTTRSEQVISHPGQVCFPGGKLDKEDKNLIECAKREAYEEVGIYNNQVKVLGQLDECITGTNYKVTPIIGLIDNNYTPIIHEREVADLFMVPLDFFLNKTNRKIESASYKGKNYSYYQFDWNDKKIWGSTARMIVNFCEIMKLY